MEWLMKFAVATFTFNSIFGIVLYWVPLLLCVIGYTLRTFDNLNKDLDNRQLQEKGNLSHYHPTDTIGSLVGRAVVSILPIANLWAGMFDISPKLFGSFFKWLDVMFNQPLVPKRTIREIHNEKNS